MGTPGRVLIVEILNAAKRAASLPRQLLSMACNRMPGHPVARSV